MTYRELKDLVNNLDESELNCDVTAYDPYNEEYIAVSCFNTDCKNGESPYLTLDE